MGRGRLASGGRGARSSAGLPDPERPHHQRGSERHDCVDHRGQRELERSHPGIVFTRPVHRNPVLVPASDRDVDEGGGEDADEVGGCELDEEAAGAAVDIDAGEGGDGALEVDRHGAAQAKR